MLIDELPETTDLREYAEEIRIAASRAETLTRQLLAFSRQQAATPEVVDVNVVVGEIERMLRRLIGENIQLSFRPGADLGHVLADPTQVEQAVVNLVVNARDAMPAGGALAIETSNVELDELYCSAHLEATPGRYVQLAVSDTGSGMDEATTARVFEPFFTTKERGKGSGLGLATVYGIVRQLGGHITVYSEPDRGSIFKIYLPHTDQAPAPAVPPELTPIGPQARTELVLVVEDETAVRAIATMVLRRRGFRVVEADSAEDALDLLDRGDEMPALLVTDIVMPGMNGRELADLLRARVPGLRVLFMSGYTDDAVMRHGIVSDEAAFLQKPFTAERLTRAVQALIDENGS
jgi:CheY-like chemotaxis protein